MNLLPQAAKQRLRILAAALMIGTMLVDAGAFDIHFFLPSSARASDSNFVANPGAYGAMLTRLADEAGKQCDIIFIGASNVEYWTSEGKPVWDHYYAPRHAFNFGVGGDKTENVLWRFDHINLSGMKPKVAVVFVGLNNFESSPKDLATGIKAVVKRTLATFPGSKVILVSLTPNGRDNDQCVQTNAILRKYANNTDIYYVDIYSKMPREGDSWKGLKPDRLHFTEDTYRMWAKQMEPLIQRFLGPLPSGSTGSPDEVPIAESKPKSNLVTQ